MKKIIDRLAYAASLSRGRRTLDIGGAKAITESYESDEPYVRAYSGIGQSASEYRVVDHEPEADYTIDLDEPSSIETLREVIDEYRPEVLLCMETLEHVNCHYEVMRQLARAVSRYGATVFISIPNNGNWILNVLGWGKGSHLVAFFRPSASLFVMRSPLGEHNVEMLPSTGKYLWFWWMVHLVSFGQPFSWAFRVTRHAES